GRSGLLRLRGLGGGGLRHGALLGLLLVVARGVVGHQDVVSIGCGFWAACGWSGPAQPLSFVICLRASRLRGSMPLTARRMTSSGRRSSMSLTVRVLRPPG